MVATFPKTDISSPAHAVYARKQSAIFKRREHATPQDLKDAIGFEIKLQESEIFADYVAKRRQDNKYPDPYLLLTIKK